MNYLVAKKNVLDKCDRSCIFMLIAYSCIRAKVVDSACLLVLDYHLFAKAEKCCCKMGKRVKVKPFAVLLLLLLSAALQKEAHPELVLFKTSLVCVFQNLDEMASEVCLLVFALQW